MVRPLGTILRSEFDADNHEQRERVAAHATCPECGTEIELTDDTEAWTKGADGRWHHSEYGPAQGVCCGLLIVYSFEGVQVFRLGGG